MAEAYIVEAIRTAGSGRGGLAGDKAFRSMAAEGCRLVS